jgi:hypothetical protein
MNLFALNRKPDVVAQRLQTTNLLRLAFNGKPLESERELTRRLSLFPACKNRKEAKQILYFGVTQNLVKVVKQRKGVSFESNDTNGLFKR